jgi:hypothetical protein
MTMHREFPHTALDQSGRPAFPSLRNAEELNLRFDRIEERLTTLEQLLGEFLNAKREFPTDSDRVATESPSDAAPRGHNTAQAKPGLLTSQHEDDAELDASVRDYVERLLRKDDANPSPASLELAPPANAPEVSERNDTALVQDLQDAQDAFEESPPTTVPENVDAGPGLERPENAPDTPPKSHELPPLRLPPERETSLDALREVANLSATAAIRTFEKSQAVRKTADRLPLLFIGLACGLMLLYSAVTSGQTALFVGAGAAFVGAALTSSQLLVILRRWLAASRPVETR